MSGHRLWLSLSVCLGFAPSCLAAPDDSDDAVAVAHDAIIYGVDDRHEVFDHPAAPLRRLASASVVGLIPRNRFSQTERGDFAIFTRPLEQAFKVCSDQRFAAQPTAADCSGVLIDDDLVLTAGHCFATDEACERFSFVFDYYYASQDALESMGWGDVYGCRRVVSRNLSTQRESPRIDYAVVQLDRVPVGRMPVALRTEPLAVDEPLATIGCASGMPLKIESGSRTLNPRSATMDYFLLDSDTFAGSSGSGVFDAKAQLVGVLVRGGTDYELRPGAECVVPKVVRLSPDASFATSNVGEEATYVKRAVDGLCASGWPSARLCAKQPSCGDGYCTADETRKLCPADCYCAGSACDRVLLQKSGESGAEVENKSRAEASGCSAHAGARTPGAWLLGVLAMLALRRRKARASSEDAG